VRPRRQRGAAMHLAADAASDTAHNGGDRMCRRSDCLLVVFGTCYFAPNICSSPPSADDLRIVLQLDVRARQERDRRRQQPQTVYRCPLASLVALLTWRDLFDWDLASRGGFLVSFPTAKQKSDLRTCSRA
jgi:hypothetical protein